MRAPLRIPLVAVGTAALLLSLSSPAGAVKPARACPAGGPFVLMTRAEVDVLAEEIFGSSAPNDALFAAYDKNGDAKLCVLPLLNKPNDASPYNFVDNTSR